MRWLLGTDLSAIRHASAAAARVAVVPPLVTLSRRMGWEPFNHRNLAAHNGEMLPLGLFVFGCAALSGSVRRFSVAARGAFELLDTARAGGCTTYDTAAVYGSGTSERILGAWVRTRKVRDEVVIVGKGGHPHADGLSRLADPDLTDDLHASLGRLGTDRIDLYMLHRDDPRIDVGPIMETLHRFVQEGKVLAVGASNWEHDRIELANQYAVARGLTPFTASSPHLSLAEMYQPPWPGSVSLTGEEKREARDWYTHSQMPVLAWSPLSGGFLTSGGARDPEQAAAYDGPANAERRRRLGELAARRSLGPEQLAVAFVRNVGMAVVPVITASSPERLRELMSATTESLTGDEVSWLDLQTDTVPWPEAVGQ